VKQVRRGAEKTGVKDSADHRGVKFHGREDAAWHEVSGGEKRGSGGKEENSARDR